MIMTSRDMATTPAENTTRMVSQAPLVRSFNRYLGVMKRVNLVGLHLMPLPLYPFGHSHLKLPGVLRQ